MTENSKDSNIIIIGIIAAFFAYLIYMKSKDTQIPIVQSPPIYYPTQSTQLIDSTQLYQIQLQTQQINETLKLQMSQIQSIQDQTLKQSERLAQLENAKCSNVVSMNDIPYTKTIYNPIRNLKLSNVSRENNELVADKIFGMK